MADEFLERVPIGIAFQEVKRRSVASRWMVCQPDESDVLAADVTMDVHADLAGVSEVAHLQHHPTTLEHLDALDEGGEDIRDYGVTLGAAWQREDSRLDFALNATLVRGEHVNRYNVLRGDGSVFQALATGDITGYSVFFSVGGTYGTPPSVVEGEKP